MTNPAAPPKPPTSIVCHYVNRALGVKCSIRLPNTKANREREFRGIPFSALQGATFTSDWKPDE